MARASDADYGMPVTWDWRQRTGAVPRFRLPRAATRDVATLVLVGVAALIFYRRRRGGRQPAAKRARAPWENAPPMKMALTSPKVSTVSM